jgi:hypothetical protein
MFTRGLIFFKICKRIKKKRSVERKERKRVETGTGSESLQPFGALEQAISSHTVSPALPLASSIYYFSPKM